MRFAAVANHAEIEATDQSTGVIQPAEVIANEQLCREHFRLTFNVDTLSGASPGQFVHLRPEIASPSGYRTSNGGTSDVHDEWRTRCGGPMLRRAFSIAGVRRARGGFDLDVIYRVVGVATHWLQSLRRGDRLSVLGPLGNAFPIDQRKPEAWLVSGGVGLPPMLFLAEDLQHAGKRTIAFCGAQTADLLALTLDPDAPPAADAGRATFSSREFGGSGTAVVISTDDGSLGFRGHVGAAMAAYHKACPIAPDELVVYTCGPEPMMRFVAEYCITRGIECHACLEQAMACGTGLCQSCVVPVRSDVDPDGWRYALCCRDGPVFEASRVVWESVVAE